MPLTPYDRPQQADIAHRLARRRQAEAVPGAPEPDAGESAEIRQAAEPGFPPPSAPESAASEPPTPPGLKARLLSVPLVGPLLRFLSALYRLGSFRAQTMARLAELDALALAFEARMQTLESRTLALETRALTLEARAQAAESHARALESHGRALENQAAAIEVRTAEEAHRAAVLRADTVALQAYVTALHADMEALGTLTRKTAADQQAFEHRITGGDAAAKPGHG